MDKPHCLVIDCKGFHYGSTRIKKVEILQTTNSKSNKPIKHPAAAYNWPIFRSHQNTTKELSRSHNIHVRYRQICYKLIPILFPLRKWQLCWFVYKHQNKIYKQIDFSLLRFHMLNVWESDRMSKRVVYGFLCMWLSKWWKWCEYESRALKSLQ